MQWSQMASQAYIGPDAQAPTSPRQHMSHSTMCMQSAVNIQGAFSVKSTFEKFRTVVPSQNLH